MKASRTYDPLKARSGRRAGRILEAMGGLGWFEIAYALSFALLVAIATNAVYDLAMQVLGRWFPPPEALANEKRAPLVILLAGSSLLLVGAIWDLKRRLHGFLDHLAPHAFVRESAPARVLIIFLSLPAVGTLPALSEDEEAAFKSIVDKRERAVADLRARLAKLFKAGEADVLDPAWLAKFAARPNWRMPLTAIADQIAKDPDHLERIIVVGSAEDANRIGTHRLDDLFCEIVNAAAQKRKLKFRAERVADTGLAQLRLKRADRTETLDLALGVPFQDFDTVYATLDVVSAELRAQGYADSDLLIDITGGLTPTSVAASIFTVLSSGRRFQYVDTNTFAVNTFNVTYDANDIVRAR